MSVVGMDEILARALRGHYAVGYFEAWDQYSLEGTLEAAEELSSPAIVGFGGGVASQPWLDRWGVESLSQLACCLAERARVPTAVIANELQCFDQVSRALQAGCNAVMLDSSALPFEHNIAATRQVVETAHALGACVEGELGCLPDAERAALQGSETDPALAAHFVTETRVDALAVSVGNVHGGSRETLASVNLELLARIHATVGVPLVIHGGTGFPVGAIRPAVACGVAKFNVGKILRLAYYSALREAVDAPASEVQVYRAVGSREADDALVRAKIGMKDQVRRLIALYGSAGKAAGW